MVSPAGQTPQYSRSIVVPLRRPSSDNASIVGAAVAGLRAIFASGYKLAKAGAMLLDLIDAAAEQFEPEAGRDAARLMAALDKVNARWGSAPCPSRGHALRISEMGLRPVSGAVKRSSDRAPRQPSSF